MTQPITYTAYRIAKMIIESEDFELIIDKDKDGDKVFKLVITSRNLKKSVTLIF